MCMTAYLCCIFHNSRFFSLVSKTHIGVRNRPLNIMDEVHHRFVSVLVLHAIMSTAASIAVGLRFYARKLTKSLVKADDWIAVAASIFVWGDAICATLGTFCASKAVRVLARTSPLINHCLENLPYLQEKPKDELSTQDQTKLLLVRIHRA
jgi:hypothetical protein